MPIFETKFEYYSEDATHSSYTDLITSTNLPQFHRLRLKTDYDVWKTNLSEGYWADRAVARQVTLMLKRTAGEMNL